VLCQRYCTKERPHTILSARFQTRAISTSAHFSDIISKDPWQAKVAAQTSDRAGQSVHNYVLDPSALTGRHQSGSTHWKANHCKAFFNPGSILFPTCTRLDSSKCFKTGDFGKEGSGACRIFTILMHVKLKAKRVASHLVNLHSIWRPPDARSETFSCPVGNLTTFQEIHQTQAESKQIMCGRGAESNHFIVHPPPPRFALA
jgi:hypothetical protein